MKDAEIEPDNVISFEFTGKNGFTIVFKVVKFVDNITFFESGSS